MTPEYALDSVVGTSIQVSLYICVFVAFIVHFKQKVTETVTSIAMNLVFFLELNWLPGPNNRTKPNQMHLLTENI